MTDTTTTPDAPTTPAASTTTTDVAVTTPEAATAPVEGQGQGEGEQGTAPEVKDGETPDTEDKAPEGPPETYEPFTLPEGVELDGERMQAAHDYARDQGWTQAKAQEMIDGYMRFRVDELQAERGLWAVQSEEEFGKDFAGISQGAGRALVEAEKVRPGITARLDATNLGNHPDVLWLVNQLGTLAKERPMLGLGGETAQVAPASQGQRMYEHADKPQRPARD